MAAEIFRCAQCGACCTGDGSVFLYPEDITALAEYYHEPIQQVVDRCTDYILMELCEEESAYLYVPYLILKKDARNACAFLRENRCSVHAAKPMQCRETPFVEEFFTDREWQKEVKKSCPALMRLNDRDIAAAAEKFSEAALREKEYYRVLRENAFNLEKILGVVLPAPRIVVCGEYAEGSEE